VNSQNVYGTMSIKTSMLVHTWLLFATWVIFEKCEELADAANFSQLVQGRLVISVARLCLSRPPFENPSHHRKIIGAHDRKEFEPHRLSATKVQGPALQQLRPAVASGERFSAAVKQKLAWRHSQTGETSA
jgi:hypothetical protein